MTVYTAAKIVITIFATLVIRLGNPSWIDMSYSSKIYNVSHHLTLLAVEIRKNLTKN